MKKIISGGIYLVVDPSMEEDLLLKRIKDVLTTDIAAVQLWNNFPNTVDKQQLTLKIKSLCHKNNVPVLVNNDLDLLFYSEADGIHFDEIPEDFVEVKQLAGGKIIGITCNNDLSVIGWAEKNELDYISFCSVFPSTTSNSCDLVVFDNIKKAKEITSVPIFLAGGINPDNIEKLEGLDFDGVAVISGIMGSKYPSETTKKYQSQLKKLKNEKRNHQ